MNLVADVINQSLDAIGVKLMISEPEEGTREAQVCLRAYRECRRQLLRAAHWDFARKQAPLTLLADASGTTTNVGNLVPQPWIYEYAYPLDCLKVRFVPLANLPVSSTPPGNISIGAQPMTTGSAPPLVQTRLIPGRFLVSTDFNNLPEIQQGTPWWQMQGISPTSRSVVLTNVQNAIAVYTADLVYVNMWDPLFRAALVAYMASEIALPLSKDPKFGLSLRDRQIAVAKEKITQARISDGNESWSTTTHTPDWMRVRTSGGARWPWSGGLWDGGIGPGVLGYGWDTLGFADGSAF